jgi:CDP-diacylglycerol--serine O-phosphatidyltransferase
MKRRTLRPLVPNFVTMLALVSGVSAIHMAIWGRWNAAILCLLASGIFDFLDGKIARLLSVSSRFGAELDSLSDFVCFGLAPGLILYHWTMDPALHLAALSDPSLKAQAVGLPWGFVLILAACCAGRLARFNAALDEEEPPYWEHFFVGVPAPAGGFLALAPLVFALAIPQWADCFRNLWVVRAFVLCAALAMASRIPTISFKHMHLSRSLRQYVFPAVAIFIAATVAWPWRVLGGIVVLYLLAMPVTVTLFCRARAKWRSANPEAAAALDAADAAEEQLEDGCDGSSGDAR